MNSFLKIIATILIVSVAVGISCGGTMLVGATIEWIFFWFGWYSWITSALLSMPVSGIIGIIVFYKTLRFAFNKKEEITWKNLIFHSRFINAMKLVGISFFIYLLFGLLMNYNESYVIYETFMVISSCLLLLLVYYYFIRKK